MSLSLQTQLCRDHCHRRSPRAVLKALVLLEAPGQSLVIEMLLAVSAHSTGLQQDLSPLPLAGNPVNQVNETINYNEHFAWSFDADYDHSYGEGLEKGLPSPILYVAEKFTTQSPCNVHRQYRISSHYATASLW